MKGETIKPTPTVKVRIKQTFTVVRTIDITTTGKSPDVVALRVAEGLIDVPAFDNPQWTEDWTLQRETVEGIE